MVRNDFVSNSSSSSFIVASTDNKYDVLLQDYDVLTLEDYIKHYIREDIFPYYMDKKPDNKFLSDVKFNEAFGRGIGYKFPLSVKDDLDAYLTLSENRPSGNWDSDTVKNWSKNLNELFEDIKKKIFESLQLKWKDVKFHVKEVDDNFIDDEVEREDDVETNEELHAARIDYINSLNPLKFYRCFSHH